MLTKGIKIGEYTLLEKVGSGGFGDVWKVEKRTALDVNYFALKFFRSADNQFNLATIGKEIQVWKQLRGLPHIISVIELDKYEDYVYVVSDFADGGSLADWLNLNGEKAESLQNAINIVLEILIGLENLHNKGFVHRDLKPANILIMNGKYCLADFGISREIKSQSRATSAAGTLEYMPPEAFHSKPIIAQQTDIWAAGVILQKLLTGNLPFLQNEQPALIAAILMFQPEKMPDNIPFQLHEIVDKCLQKEPNNRFRSAIEMQFALKKVLAELPDKTINSVNFNLNTAPTLRNEPTQIDETIKEVYSSEEIYQPADTQPAMIESSQEFTKTGIHLFETPTEKIISSENIQPPPTLIVNKTETKPAEKPGIAFMAVESRNRFNVGLTIGLIIIFVGVFGIVAAVGIYYQMNKGVAESEQLTQKALDEMMSGNYKKAVDLANQALTLNEKSAMAHAIKGRSLREADKSESNIKELQTAINLEPENGVFIAWLALNYYNLEKRHLAKQSAEQSILRLKEPKSFLEAEAKGLAFLVQNDFDSAIQNFDKAIAFKPTYAVLFYNRASAYYNKNDLDRALEWLEQTIKLNADFDLAYYLRSYIYSNKNELEKADQDINKAIELNPNESDYYSQRGNLNLIRKNNDEAIKDFNRATIVAPNEPQSYESLARAYAYLKKFDLAEKNFNRAIELDPNRANSFAARCFFYFQKDALETALRDCDKAAELDSENYLSYKYRGEIYSIKKDYDSALKNFDKAIELYPSDESNYLNRGFVYFQKGNIDQSINDYRKALELNPKNKLAKENLDIVLRRKKESR